MLETMDRLIKRMGAMTPDELEVFLDEGAKRAEHVVAQDGQGQKPKYRPFANAKEFAPHRNKWLVGDSGRTWYAVLRFNKDGVTLGGDLFVPYAGLYSFGYVFEDGSPTGVKM